MDIRETVGEIVKSLRVKTKNSTWWTKWFWYVLAGSLGLLLIAGVVFETLQKSKKAAKAMHQRDVLIEKQTQAEVNSLVAKTEKKKQVLINKADKHVEEADKKLALNKKLVSRVNKNKKIINKLRDWDDAQLHIKYPDRN